MIDLHSHILPFIDDGSSSDEMSIEMARLAVADGTTKIACTPHFMPGVFETTSHQLFSSVEKLKKLLELENIPLELVPGGDLHATPDLIEKLKNNEVPRLGESSYFLFEPPHNVMPPNLDVFCGRLLDQDFIPILTHPERLTWIERHYDVVCKLDEMGVPIQITAKSILGGFGQRVRYWSEVMLKEGRVDIVASDAHNITSRPPGLTEAKMAVELLLDQKDVDTIFLRNPELVLKNQPLVKKRPRKSATREVVKKGWFSQLFTKFGYRKR